MQTQLKLIAAQSEAEIVADSVPCEDFDGGEVITLDNAPEFCSVADGVTYADNTTASIIATIKRGALSADNLSDIMAAIMEMADSALV